MAFFVFVLLTGATVVCLIQYTTMRDRISDLERQVFELDQENIRLRKQAAGRFVASAGHLWR